MQITRRAFALGAATIVGTSGAGQPTSDVSLLDLIELDMGYTTIADSYYRHVSAQQLIDGARVGLVAYLRRKGLPNAGVPVVRARPDGRGVVPAIGQQIGKVLVRYGSRVDARALVYSAIAGELAALHDPYSVFFSKADLQRFTTALDGTTFGGIGIVVAADAQQRYRVDDVFAAGPAFRAGVTTGDTIVSIDGTTVAGLRVDALTALLRGRVGTVVRLDLCAGGSVRDVDVVRAAIHPPDVSQRMLPMDIGYIALRTFGPAAGPDVHSAVLRLHALGARAAIFDLRGNGGGYESSAVQVASAFIGNGPIVVTQTKHGSKHTTSADHTAPAPLPLVVLVDGDSASGSELVAGAIADHRLGTLVGTRTFGKGVVQTMFPLPDGSALKLTTARYFTAGGHDIDRVGIVPDVVVRQPDDAQRGVPGRDAQLDAALALLSAKLAGATPQAVGDLQAGRASPPDGLGVDDGCAGIPR